MQVMQLKYSVAVNSLTITPFDCMDEYHLKEMWKSPNIQFVQC